jgi:FemAB-related protein (PEP-CTERM system-associated)
MSTRTDCLPMAIKRLMPNDTATAARWDAFVMACPEATFFHRSGWQNVVRRVFHHDTHFLYAEAGGQINGVLPLGHVNSWLFGKSLVSLPFAVYGGVAARDAAVAQALEQAARQIATDLGVAHLECRNRQARHTDWPVQTLYVTFRKEIFTDEETNLLAIPRKQRAMVRKGIRNGLMDVLEHHVENFFPLYADNVHRHGTPALPRRYFEALLAEFGKDCEVLTVSAADGEALSSVLSFYFRDEVLPYYAGDAMLARETAANDFKYWALLSRACARGLRVFDFGRSKQGTGSYAFKKNWGFEPSPLHYEYCLLKRDAIPQNNPSNTKYRHLIAAWKLLPRGVANWLGPFVVRSLG